MKRKYIYIKIFVLLLTCNSIAFAQLINPIKVTTNQNIYNYLPKETLHKRLISIKQQNNDMVRFFHHFFSPWHKPSYTATKNFKLVETRNIHFYKKNLGWGENFHHHNKKWINDIVNNMNILTFPNTNKNAITTDNAYVRVMPTITPHYYNFREAGQGYPFDNFQETVLWAGTPIRVLQLSRNGDWAFVVSPSVSGWVQMKSIAFVDSSFMSRWKKSKFAATITNKTPVKDLKGYFRFDAYMGSVFPVDEINRHSYTILIPVANNQYQATIQKVMVTHQQMTLMPFEPTPQHFADLIDQLLGTPYGWGGLYFYNDCSGTLKSLFTPFSLWLPRNSKAQADMGTKTRLDSHMASTQKNLLRQATPFYTLIYLPGHIMMYVGQASNGNLITFQNFWAFITKGSDGNEGRAIVGKAALMDYIPYTQVPYYLVSLR